MKTVACPQSPERTGAHAIRTAFLSASISARILNVLAEVAANTNPPPR
jgi:hypothetical protein